MKMRQWIAGALTAIVLFASVQSPVLAEADWEEKREMPISRYNFGTAAIGGKIYVVGGDGLDGTVDEYDPETDTWTRKEAMPTPRDDLTVSAVNGKLYAIGGRDYDGNPLNTVEEYDPATNTWTTKQPIPTPRFLHAAAVYDGKIYIIGGSDQDYFHYTNIVEVYDPATDTWSRAADMPTARHRHGAAVLNGMIYAVGGFNEQPLDVIEAYDPAADAWSSAGALPEPRSTPGVETVHNRLFVIGGAGTQNDYLASTGLYDPRTGHWHEEASLSPGRSAAGTATVHSTVYVFGGQTLVGLSRQVLAYDVPVPPPAPVTDLTADGGDGEVRLSWSENPEADSYIVKRSNTSGGPYTVLADQVAETSYTDTEVENGTTYYYIVTAVNASGESPPSDEVSATPGEARALVHIILETGLEKTYDWTKDEAVRFAEWFEDRADGFAPAYYKITTRDPASNTIRTEYLLFDKIVFIEFVYPDHS